MATLYDSPRNQKDLYFQDAAPEKAAYFTHDFGDYSLEARILFNAKEEQPWVFSIHGARADYTKANWIVLGLQKRGISLLGCNLSGHNRVSPLKPEETSLGNNIREAEAFYQYLDPKKPKTLIAFSLGATPALKVLGNHPAEIDKLILFGPAIYSKEAYDKPFGKPFRDVISRPWSFHRNDVVSTLDRFPGRLLVVKGQYDGLPAQEPGRSAGEVMSEGEKRYSPIPAEVFTMLMATAISEDRKELFVIPGGDHLIAHLDKERSDQAGALLDRLAHFILE